MMMEFGGGGKEGFMMLKGTPVGSSIACLANLCTLYAGLVWTIYWLFL